MSKKINRRNKNDAGRVPVLLGTGMALIGLIVVLLLFGKYSGAESKTNLPDSSSSSSSSVTPVEVNYTAPELSLQNANGNKEALTDYRGQIVLVNNWATWCPPCKAEIPTLEEYYKVHSEEGFVIIGIEAGESQAEVAQFVKSSAITYPIWIDLKHMSLYVFGSSGLPSSFVIDRKGMVRLSWVGEINREMLEKYVTPLIAEN